MKRIIAKGVFILGLTILWAVASTEALVCEGMEVQVFWATMAVIGIGMTMVFVAMDIDQ